MNILFKFPTRSRPKKFFETLENLRDYANLKDHQCVVSFDVDDKTMNDKSIIERATKEYGVEMIGGISRNKIDAVNRDIIIHPSWDILVVMSDDMKFVEKDADKTIISDMEWLFPDTDGVLHYNDGNQKDNVMTLSIMGKSYYMRDKYVYSKEYESVWCDVEETEKAFMRGKLKYMGDSKVIFRHLHPAWGLGEYDEQYRKTEDSETEQRDKAVFLSRRERNYFMKENEIVNCYKYGKL